MPVGAARAGIFRSGVAIPDSVVAQYNAQDLSGFSDGDLVSTWPDGVGGFDANGEATFRSSGINGNPSLEFDATDDGFSNTSISVSTPLTVIAVIDPDFTSSDVQYIYYSRNTTHLMGFNSEWRINAGSNLFGTSTVNRAIITGVFDGSSSEIREDQSQTGTGDPGGNNLDGIDIGTDDTGGDVWNGDIGLLEIHDGLPSNGVATREQEVANLFGI